MRVVVAILVLVLLPVVATLLVTASDSGEVYEHSLPNGSQAFIIDYDNDGSYEVVTDAGTIIGTTTEIHLNNVSEIGRGDLNGDGRTEIVIVTNTSTITLTDGVMNTVADVTGELQSWYYGFRVGKTYFVNGEQLRADGEGVPLVINGTPAIVVANRDGVYFVTKERNVELAPFVNVVVAGARSVGDKVEVVLASESVTIMMNVSLVTGSIEFTEVQTPPVDWGTWLPTVGAYLITGGNTAYLLYPNGTVSVIGSFTMFIYPLETVEEFALVNGREVTVFDGVEVVDRIQLPEEPKWFDYRDGAWVAVTEGKLLSNAIKWFEPVYIEASISLTPSVYVNDTLTITAEGNFKSGTLAIGTSTYFVRPGDTVEYRPNTPGTLKVSLTACSGADCVRREASVTVLPRPLELLVMYPDAVSPYSKFNVSVEAKDGITGEVVRATCSVSVSNQTVPAVSPTNVTLMAVPSITSKNELPGTVVCSANGYSPAEKHFIVYLSEPYIKVTYQYLGSGRVLLELVNRYTGEAVTAPMTVLVDGALAGNFTGRAVIPLRPGNHTVKVMVVVGGNKILEESFSITYYPTVFSAPATVPVYVADRVTTETSTTTVTTRATVTVYQPRLVETVSVPLAVTIATISAVGGVGAALALQRIVKRHEQHE